MKTTVHDPLTFDVLGSGLVFTEGPVITLWRSGRAVETPWRRPGLPLHAGSQQAGTP
jgi:hypothetical protein